MLTLFLLSNGTILIKDKRHSPVRKLIFITGRLFYLYKELNDARKHIYQDFLFMKVIAESGSTTTEWVLVVGKNVLERSFTEWNKSLFPNEKGNKPQYPSQFTGNFF